MDDFTSRQQYCSYYQAFVERTSTWFVVAVLKSFDHMLFDRTLHVNQGLFEFFVPADVEQFFLIVMDYLIQEKYVHDLKKLPNRLQDPAQQL